MTDLERVELAARRHLADVREEIDADKGTYAHRQFLESYAVKFADFADALANARSSK